MSTRTTLDPKNLTAQLLYRAVGNPESVLPSSAISNCYPGLEFDFRNVWRRIFAEIILQESSNFVVAPAPGQVGFDDLVEHRLLLVDWHPVCAPIMGPQIPGRSLQLLTPNCPNGITFMEWSNALAKVVHERQGHTVLCHFTLDPSRYDAPIPLLPDGKPDESKMIARMLTVQHLFAPGGQAVIAEKMVEPGELTQGLCSPWQNDYRECSCYYWAASRPDYVNVEPDAQGTSRGDHWLQKERTGHYVLDNFQDSRLYSYNDLFEDWQGLLGFVIDNKDEGGPDAEARREEKAAGEKPGGA